MLATKENVFRQVLATLVLSQTHVVLGVLVAFGGLFISNTQAGGEFAHLSASEVTWIISVNTFGMATGSLVSAPLTNSFGVLRVTLYSSIFNIAAHTCLFLGRDVTVLILGRILMGLFIGINIGGSRLYIAEVANETLRGVLCHAPSIIFCLGFLVPVALTGIIPWRWATLICGCLPTTIHLAGIMWMPDSARWIVARGRSEQEAVRSIKFYRGTEHDVTSELKAIHASIGGELRRQYSLFQQLKLVFTTWDNAKPVLLLIGQFFFDSFCGGVAIAQYAPLIFRQAAPRLNPHTSTLYLAAFQLLSLCISGVLVSRVGRRAVLSVAAVTGAVGCSMVAAAGLAGEALQHHSWVPLLGVLMANAAAQAGVAPVSYIYLGEILPTAIRPLFGSCFVIYVSSIGLVTMHLVPMATHYIGTEGLFLCIAGFCCLQLLYALVFLPETKDLTLEEVQVRHFSSRKPKLPESEQKEEKAANATKELSLNADPANKV